MRVHWHRRDLRLADNRGIADTDEPTVGLFVFDDEALATAGPPRVAFLLEALSRLREQYRERGGELVFARGDPVDVVPTLQLIVIPR
jgi:Deoxyribodipyrimidine photolyase